jgi:FAD/FMN-containing dehydrogenase
MDVGLHFNKGLYGAPEASLAASRDTATNPAVLDAFALAIIGNDGPPAFAGLGNGPDEADARGGAARVRRAYDTLCKAAPRAGSYVSESDYFQAGWQEAFWGSNHPRLLAAKRRYDPDGVFTVHHGVGSEAS